MAKRASGKVRKARGLVVAMTRRHASTTINMVKRNRKRAKDARRHVLRPCMVRGVSFDRHGEIHETRYDGLTINREQD